MNFQLLGLSFPAILLFSIFLFLIIRYFFLLNRNDIKSKKIIFTCRLTTLILLLLLIMNPSFEWNEISSSKSDLNIYLDNSKSMPLIGENIDFNNKIKEIMDWAKSNNIHANMYLFGDSIREYNFSNRLNFTDKNSSLDNISKNIMFDKNSTHLIITDGQINKGQSMDDIIINNDNMFISGIGRQLNEDDCHVESINTKYSDLNLIDVIVTISCDITNDTRAAINLVLSDYHNENIFSNNIIYLKDDGFLDVVFKDLNSNLFNSVGQAILTTDFQESNINNNNKYFRVKDRENIQEILLLTGTVSNNTRFLKELLNYKFPNLDINHHIYNQQLNYNELNNYSLIMLDNFPSKNKEVENFKYIVNNFSNIPIIYFEGPGLSLNIGKHIAGLLNIDLSLNDHKNRELLVYGNNVVFRNIDFDRFSPSKKNILWTTNNSFINPISYFNNNSRIKSISAIKNTDKFSGVFIPNLASMNLIEKNTYNSENLINYISQIILYEYESLASFINFNINKIEHPKNNIISTTLNIDERIIDMNIYMIKNDLDNELLDTMILDNVTGEYAHDFTIDKTGFYSIQFVAEDDYSQYQSNKEYLVVNDFDIESQFLYQNQKSIANFKDNNKAIYLNFKNLSSDLDKITVNRILNKEKKYINSLSSQYYWVILILLLTVEWYLRKKSKLL